MEPVINTKRNASLELLRGIASVSVVVWHSLVGFFPARSGLFEEFDPHLAFIRQPWFGLVNGSGAVDLFFVLSGYVLTRRYFLKRDPNILVRSAIKRYPRMVGPILATTIASSLLFLVGAFWHKQAALITKSRWLDSFGYAPPFDTGLINALHQGLIGTPLSGNANFDTSFWTMRYEMVGSFTVFGIALLLGGIKSSRLSQISILAVVSLLCHFSSALLVAFPVGMALALFLPEHPRIIAAKLAWPLGVFAVYLIGYSWTTKGAYAPFKILNYAIPSAYFHFAAASILITLLESCPALKRLADHNWALWLGRISFPLYLLHFLVLCSAGCAVLVATNDILPHPIPQLGALIVTLAGSLVVASLATPLDAWWVSAIDHWTKSVKLESAGDVKKQMTTPK